MSNDRYLCPRCMTMIHDVICPECGQDATEYERGEA